MLSAGNSSKIFAAFVVGCVLILSSCESNRWFQSESTLSAKIQNTWDKIKINPTSNSEEWTFKEGTVYRVIGPVQTPIDIDTGHYSVSTTLSKAFLTINDFNRLADNMNGKWEILELSGGVLFIATDHNGSSGVQQLEFQEK
jgi:hypothetical protein